MRYLLILALMASCSPLYLSGTRNTPLFTEGGEAQVTGYLSAAGIEAQGAYSLTDNVVITGSYGYASQKKTSNGVEYSRKNNFAELGLGIYNTTRSLRWEIIGGYAIGESTSSDVYGFFAPTFGAGTETVATGKFSRIIFQPSIGTNSRGTNLSFTPRLSWVDFSEFTSQGVTVKPGEKSVMFLEPAATLKFHLAGNIFGVFQLGLTVPMSDAFFKYQQLQASVGLQIDTGGLRTRVY
jgi:hypothetical protein